MIKLFFLILIFFSVFTEAADISKTKLQEIRTLYYSSVENEEDLERLENMLIGMFPENVKRPGIITAYMAAAEAVKGKHAFWPITKLGYLRSAMDSLESVIKIYPDDLEIRFIRFSILHHLPKILGYSSETKEDAAVILDLLKNHKFGLLDNKIVIGIAEFIYRSGRISDENKNELVSLFPGMKTDE